MIKAVFFRNCEEKLVGFSISGHSGLYESGEDIACASVSSAVMLTVNTITEAFKIKAEVKVLDNEIQLKLEKADEISEKILLGFLLHLECLSEDFEGAIKLTFSEV